jgi:hypothetical protein
MHRMLFRAPVVNFMAEHQRGWLAAWTPMRICSSAAQGFVGELVRCKSILRTAPAYASFDDRNIERAGRD